MKEDSNQLTALFLAFTIIGAMYGIINLFGMLLNL